MLFLLNYNGQEYQVRVESRRSRLYITFNDEEEERVDIAFYGDDCTFIRNNKVFCANVAGKKSDYTVWHPDHNLNINVESEYKRIVGRLRGQDLENENKVVAKMPGKIVKVLIKKGQEVKKGDAVIVMEAMKMENEIRSSMEGKISSILVKEGQAVESGELLAELESQS